MQVASFYHIHMKKKKKVSSQEQLVFKVIKKCSQSTAEKDKLSHKGPRGGPSCENLLIKGK